MGFHCGIIGLPNVGKSTIFNALASQQVDASNYPFCTVDPNHGVVPLQDHRLETIRNIIGSAKQTPTTLEFVDIAGLVKGASRGEGLGNQFLNHIQQVDALAHIVRCFEDPNVTHIDMTLDPVRDAEIVNIELALKDHETIAKQLHNLKRIASTGDKKARSEYDLLTKIQNRLNEGEMISQMSLTPEERKVLHPLNLLTSKPILYIANVDEEHQQENPCSLKLKEFAENRSAAFLQLCGKAQAEVSRLDEESQQVFLEELGLDELGLQKMVRTGYQLLDLITFFTANQNETRAWTVGKGTNVQQAGGKIHSDFERGFIRAEVMKYQDLAQYGSDKALHERGLIAVHGRDYIVEDGDIIFYKFKV